MVSCFVSCLQISFIHQNNEPAVKLLAFCANSSSAALRASSSLPALRNAVISFIVIVVGLFVFIKGILL